MMKVSRSDGARQFSLVVRSVLKLWCLLVCVTFILGKLDPKVFKSENFLPNFRSSSYLGKDRAFEGKGCTSSKEFDFFLLAQSWQPEFCYGNYEKYPGCKHPKAFWKENLTLHGLWPQNLDGSYPCSCEGDPFRPTTITSVGMNWMVTEWPNVKYDQPGSQEYDSFWQHEWDKHGVCSQLPQEGYFESSLSKLEEFGTPKLISQRKGATVSKNELSEAYGGKDMATFICNSGKHLSQVYMCVSKDPNSYPLGRMPCPPSVIFEGTCGDTIHIADFIEIPDQRSRHHSNRDKGSAREHLRVGSTPTSDDSDFYLLALIWQPEACEGHEEDYPGCQKPEAAWTKEFTIHGLWPNYYNGGWPQFCTSEKLDVQFLAQIGMEILESKWPNVRQSLDSPQYVSFWEHEWDKHGTCTGMSQEKYFSETLALYTRLGTPSFISDNVGKVVSQSDILQSFGGENMAILICDDGVNLSQVYICIEEKFSTIGASEGLIKFPCPTSVDAENTCGSNIYIPSLLFG